MYRQVVQVYLKPQDVAAQEASKILDKLNAFNTAEEIASVVALYAGKRVLSVRLAQRILNKKLELGRFQDLRQVALVPGVGTKKLSKIIFTLGEHI